MNQPQRKRGNQRQQPNRPKEPKAPDLWRGVPALPDPQPIVHSDDVTAMVRSLGDPPLPGKSVVSGHYVAAVVERASHLAAALATSVDLLSYRTDE